MKRRDLRFCFKMKDVAMILDNFVRCVYQKFGVVFSKNDYSYRLDAEESLCYIELYLINNILMTMGGFYLYESFNSFPISVFDYLVCSVKSPAIFYFYAKQCFYFLRYSGSKRALDLRRYSYQKPGALCHRWHTV
jgi:hypothetical protein